VSLQEHSRRGCVLLERHKAPEPYEKKEPAMIGWAITFLVIALIAAIFGFGGIAGTAITAAKIIFFVAIVLFAISALIGLFRGRSSAL
jgi:uncharacterized membrane protein YtjA (UPF0391 family)